MNIRIGGIPINAKSLDDEVQYQVGTEKLNIGVFIRMICNWKDSDVSPMKFKSFPPKETLPFMSTLHLLDNFRNIEEGKPISDICSFDNPFINNENLRKILSHQLTPMTDGWIKTPKDYIYRTMQLARNIEKFRSTNNGRFIIRRELKELDTKDTALTIINHNPIFRMFVRGTLLNWRATQHYLASIFNTVAFIPERTHFFVIPLSDKIFVKGKFIQIANKVSASSVIDKKSYQYCFFAQLYNFLNINCSLKTVFDEIPEEFRRKIILVFEHAGHYLFWPLQTLKDLNARNRIYNRIFNHFNGFILRGITEKEAKLNTLENMVVDDTPESTKDVEKEIIKHYANVTKTPIKEVQGTEETTEADTDYISEQDISELEEMTRRVEEFPLRMGEKSTILDLTDVNDIIEGDSNQQEPVLDVGEDPDTEVITEKADKDLNAPANAVIAGEPFYTAKDKDTIRLPDTDAKPFTEAKEIAENGKEYMSMMDDLSVSHINANTNLTNAQKERAKKMALSYKNVTVGKKTIAEILSEPVDPKLSEDDISTLPPSVVPDKSMLKSSIVSVDQEYMEKLFTKHLVGVASSFATQGMYLQSIEKSITNTELSQIQTFVMKYKTVEGKQHTCVASMPIIRPDGTFLVNGVRSSMAKQLSVKPIAKLSDTRVSLASNYNKTIVEKLSAKAHDYLTFFTANLNHIKDTNPQAISDIQYEIREIPNKTKCGLEYFQLAKKYRSITINHQKHKGVRSFLFFGDPKTQFDDPIFTKECKFADKDWKEIEKIEKENGWTFIGAKVGNAPYSPAKYFMDIGSILHMVGTYEGKAFDIKSNVMELITLSTGVQPKKRLTEWTDIKILDAKFPVGFLLCYRFGLLNVLRRLNCTYELVAPRGTPSGAMSMTNVIVIPFSDKKLVIARYPLKISLLLQGLTMFDTKQGALEDYDHKDIYYQLLLDKNMGAGRTNYLIGIDDTFDMFIDFITYSRLKQMNEPTTFGGLLVRATEMLSVPYHNANTAMTNHCLRSYERLNGIMYNEMAAQMRMYKKQRGPGASFSINPHAVMNRIVTDPTVMPMEDINPIHDLKTTTKMTYLGMGGRTIDSITAKDRTFPPDGLGIVSESTPSAGNVGVVIQSSMDPTIDNVSGVLKHENEDELQPTQMLSVCGLYMPCVTQDDSKRLTLASNFLSHTIPTKEGEVLRVRTGFETVIANRCSDLFAYSAKDDGVVIDVNEKLGMVRIKYKNGKEESFSYNTQYGQCSDMLVEQRQKLTIKKGDKFKKNEILRYNPQFFTADPDNPRIVSYNHGVTARVALLETSVTTSDSNAISKELGAKLEIYPVIDRLITIPSKALVHTHLNVGDDVNVNSPLLIFEKDDTTDLAGIGVDEKSLEYLEGLNRSAPKAKNTGKIVDIKVFYSCDLSYMHDSVAKMVNKFTAQKRAIGKYVEGSENKYLFAGDSQIPVGSKYKGITIDEDTIVLQYYIQEAFDQGAGDKIVIDSSLKTVTCKTMDIAPVTEMGHRVDVLFSVESLSHRIVNSPFLVGIAEATMDTLEQKCIDMYFGGGNKEVAHEAMKLPLGEKVYMRDASFDYVSRTDVTPILDEMSSDFLGETFTPKEWADRNEDEFKLFIKVDDTGKEEIIGFCLLAYQGIDTDDKDDPRNSPLVGNIWWFAIRKKFRGQGYGTAIYPYILKYLKNDKHMRAVITAYRAINKPAGKLYMNFGLKPYAEIIQIPHRPGHVLKKLPEGFDFYKSGEKIASRVKDELDEFVKNHMACKGPDWIFPTTFNISGKNAFMLRRDETGKIVSLITMNTRMFSDSDDGDKPKLCGNVFYPMATDEKEFKLLMDTALSIKAFDKVNSIYCVFGKDHPFKGILYKYGKITSIKLAKKL